MKKVFVGAVVYSVFALSMANAQAACEKWKSEVAATIYDLGHYIKVYGKYKSGKMNESELAEESREIVGKLEKIKAHVYNTESCQDSAHKYEDRRSALKNAIGIAIPVIQQRKLLEDVVRETLKKHENE